MQLLLRQGKMQRFGHLLFRRAARSGVRHGQRSGDAVWREEQVALLAPKLLIQFEREPGIVIHECRLRCPLVKLLLNLGETRGGVGRFR